MAVEFGRRDHRLPVRLPFLDVLVLDEERIGDLEVHTLYSGAVVNVPDDELVTVCRKDNPRGG